MSQIANGSGQTRCPCGRMFHPKWGTQKQCSTCIEDHTPAKTVTMAVGEWAYIRSVFSIQIGITELAIKDTRAVGMDASELENEVKVMYSILAAILHS